MALKGGQKYFVDKATNLSEKQHFPVLIIGSSIVLLDFWIKNCGPCIASIPHLNALQEKFKNKKLRILGINSYDPEKDITWFSNRHRIDYEVLMNGGDVAEKYGVTAYPTIVILGKNGKVLYLGSGFDKLKIEESVKHAL